MFVMPHAELERARRLLGSEPRQNAADESLSQPLFELESPQKGSLAALFYCAGLSPKAVRTVYLRVLAEVVIGVILTVLLKTPWLVLVGAVGVFVEYQAVRRKSFVRAEAFERDYTAFLLSLASAVRTGLDPLTALLDSEKLFAQKSEVRREILRVKDGIERGLPEETVLQRFADSIAHPDVKLFRTAFILARREGSSLAECLQRLARVTRHRQSFRRKVRSAVAMQKLSSFGIAACTIVIGIIQATTNPDAFRLSLQHPLGVKLLGVGAVLIVGGLAWMLSMTRTRL